MTATLLDMPREKKAAETDNARVGREVMKKARVVAAHLGVTLPEYLTDALKPKVDQDYALAADAIAKRAANDAKRKQS